VKLGIVMPPKTEGNSPRDTFKGMHQTDHEASSSTVQPLVNTTSKKKPVLVS
jgi:hypothetical protein